MILLVIAKCIEYNSIFTVSLNIFIMTEHDEVIRKNVLIIYTVNVLDGAVVPSFTVLLLNSINSL